MNPLDSYAGELGIDSHLLQKLGDLALVEARIAQAGLGATGAEIGSERTTTIAPSTQRNRSGYELG